MKLVVGDYLEVAGSFDGVCLVDSSFKRITEAYPSIKNTVQQLVSKYGKRVLNLGMANGQPRVIFVPTQPNEIEKSCNELVGVADKLQFNSIIIPKPYQYEEFKDIMNRILDDRFILISDNADDIPVVEKGAVESIVMKSPVPVTNTTTKKILECSSKGDKRFSAMYATVEYADVNDTIENHYQSSKRFLVNGEYIQLSPQEAKGKKVDACCVFDELYTPELLTAFYKWLWLKYLTDNKELLEYAKTFDDYNDMFKGKAINCQADVIREICNDIESVKAYTQAITDLEDKYIGFVSEPSDNICYSKQQHIASADKEVIEIVEPSPTTSSQGVVAQFDTEDTIEIKPITLCVTGHRPKDLWGYNPSANYSGLQNKIYQCLTQFHTAFGVTRFVSGGAQGVDQLFFGAVDYYRSQGNNVENVVYIPFKGQESSWLKSGMFSQDEYNTMLSKATSTKLCSTSVTNLSANKMIVGALMDRNTHMVNDSDYVLGVFKGDFNLITNDVKYNSGTLDCLRKAYKAGRKMVVINPNNLSTCRFNM